MALRGQVEEAAVAARRPRSDDGRTGELRVELSDLVSGGQSGLSVDDPGVWGFEGASVVEGWG